MNRENLIKEILKAVEDAFNDQVSAEGWLDFGTPMADLTGKQEFLKQVEEKVKAIIQTQI